MPSTPTTGTDPSIIETPVICYHPPSGGSPLPEIGGGAPLTSNLLKGGGDGSQQDSGIASTDVGRISIPNVFQNVNTFPGIRLGAREISSDYQLTFLDCQILAHADAGSITATLPPALGSGQLYQVEKADPSANPVILLTSAGDLIEGQSSVTLGSQFADVIVQDVALGEFVIWGLSAADLADLAHISLQNKFTNLNTFTGIRVGNRIVLGDDDVGVLDYSLLAYADAGPMKLSLPKSTGSGQVFFFAKMDTTSEVVTVQAQTGDLIDTAFLIALVAQGAKCYLLDAAEGQWVNMIPDDAASGPVPGLGSPITEVPSGAVNGSNTVFTVSVNFTTIAVYWNGVRQTPGVDYNVTGGNQFTMIIAPPAGAFLVDYYT